MKRILQVTLLVLFFGLLGFCVEFYVPRLNQWILAEVVSQSDELAPVLVVPMRMHWNLWPIGLSFEDVRIIPKGEVSRVLAPAKIQEVRIEIQPLALIQGYFGISNVVIKAPSLTVVVPKDRSKKSQPQPPLGDIIRTVLQLPLFGVEIQDLDLKLKESNSEILTHINGLNLNYQNNRHSGVIEIDTEGLALKHASSASVVESMGLSTRIAFNPNLLKLSTLKISKDRSFVVASGELMGSLNHLEKADLNLEGRVISKLDRIQLWVETFSSEIKLPKLSGLVQLDIKVHRTNDEGLRAEATARGANVEVSQFKIGKLDTDLRVQGRKLRINRLAVKNDAGAFEVQKTDIDMNSKKGSATVDISDIELHKLFHQLGLPAIPVYLGIQGKLPCTFEIEDPRLDCTGNIHASNFRLESSDSKEPLIALRQIQINGKVHVDKNGVSPEGEIQVGSSKGTAKGVVDFEKGFHFNFDTAALNTRDIESLVGLKWEGSVALKGETQGDKEAATVEATAASNDFWLEDFGIGNMATNANFKKGKLYLKNIQGTFKATKYQGDLTLDVDNKLIEAQIQVPYAEANDIQLGLSRKMKLPFEIIGTGEAKVKVSGPLDFSHLTYHLDSAVYRGFVGREPFDEFHFDIDSEKGMVKSRRMSLRKAKGVATMNAQGDPSGQFRADLATSGVMIEDFETLSKTGLSISGLFDLKMGFKGHIRHPEIAANGILSRTRVGQEPVPDSNFQFRVGSEKMEGSGRFLGGDINLDFIFPLSAKAPFKLVLNTEHWNFAPLFSLISTDITKKEFDTELSAHVDLQSPQGGFWNSTGNVNIGTLRIRRGSLEMFAPEPLKVRMQNGLMHVEHFLVQGDNTYFNLLETDSTEQKLNLQLNGKIELGLLSFLTPFLSDIRGVLSLSTQLTGSASDPHLIGTAFVEKGFAKPKGMPHALDDFKLDVLFSQDRVLVNHIEGKFASGVASADGVIEIKGSHNFPTKLKGQFQNVELNIPDGVTTKGSGDFKVAGSWFPFLFSARYDITEGLVTTTFQDQNGADAASVRRSSFLPPLLLEKDFEPFNYDIQTNFPSNMKVKNALFDSDISGNLAIRGPMSAPLFFGEVNAKKGGKLFFRDIPFEITTASIKFVDPKENNPLIYAEANSRVKDYDVTLVVQGTLKENRLILRSSPPLADQEIISLLALGITQTDLERNVKSDAQASEQSYQIGSAILSQNPLNREIKKRYGVDVKFSSAIDETDNAAVPKVILNKQWTPKVGTSASRTIGNKVVQDVKLQYLFNNNISAIGSFQSTKYDEQANGFQNEDFFGLDLQYKVEFK